MPKSIQLKPLNYNKAQKKREEHEQPLLRGDEAEQEDPVFGPLFKVDPIDHQSPQQHLPNPEMFIPKQTKDNIETFLEKCGELAMGLGFLALMCGCKIPSIAYQQETSTVGIVETFGQLDRLLLPGINLVNPCTQAVIEVDLRMQVVHVGRISVQTKDNVQVNMDISLGYRIVNPVYVHYQLGEQVDAAVVEVAADALRKVGGMYVLEDVLGRRGEWIEKGRLEMGRNVSEGVEICKLWVEDMMLEASVEHDLSSVARQRRTSQAYLIETQANVKCAQLMKQSSQLLGTQSAMQIRYLELIDSISNHDFTLVLPIGQHRHGTF